MKKNKKGFTLVELIFCIAIVAALTLAATLGLQKVLRGNKAGLYKNDLREILDDTKTYLDITKAPDAYSYKYIKLGDLVEAGYIDEDFYNKINGFTCENFSSDTKFYYLTENGIRNIYYMKSDGIYCNLDDLENDDNCKIQEDC